MAVTASTPVASAPAALPPRASLGPVAWVRVNLLTPWYNAVITAVLLYALAAGLSTPVRWAIVDAHWGTSPEVCRDARRAAQERGVAPGACWAVIPANIRLFLVGTYPVGQGHRPLIALVLVLALGALSLVRRAHGKALVAAWLLSFPAVLLILHGFQGSAVLPQVETARWGGLLLTFLLTIVAIVVSFPLGVALALGRRSTLPAVRWVSTAYIETVRGVPLVTILFMASVMFPLLLPGHLRIDKVARAMLALVLFSAAYLAENVRGGLQAISPGQYDAARALGLGRTLTMGLVVLPQALRIVIPPVVGQFIGLFKDTSLVAVIGLLDLFEIGRSILSNPNWLGLRTEIYVFVGAVYWIFSYSMSLASRRLERRLGAGTR